MTEKNVELFTIIIRTLSSTLLYMCKDIVPSKEVITLNKIEEGGETMRNIQN